MHSTGRTILLGLLLWPVCLFAQQISGRVVDHRTLEPLAFVHVLADGAREGTTTDIDGRFTIPVAASRSRVQFSYVGYAPLEMELSAGEPVLVRMQRTAIDLGVVEILPGENPAHRIIRNVYANRKANDGMRNRSHRYTSYSKTIFTAAMDSAVINDPEKIAALDSNDLEAIDWLDRQHLLLIESATAKSFIPPAAAKEEVIAMRVSGLKDPSLLALAASITTFSIYEPQIAINEKTYLSPIGPGSTERYLFLLQDTLYQGSDSVFVISFQPRNGRKFEALKGVLYVNTGGYALQNVIAEPVERENGISMKVQQQFEKVNGQVWFPVQLNTFLYLDFVQVGSWKLLGIGRTFLKDIQIDVDIRRKEVRGADLVLEREAMRKDEALWSGLREMPLDDRDVNTYHVMDSLGEALNLDRKLKWLTTLYTGRIPIGIVDLRLDQLLAYNGYEGLRPGIGLVTNERITRYGSLGGYVAYGFHDEEFKYGGDLTIQPRPGRDLWIRGYYENDVAESGGVEFPDRKVFNNDWYRQWFIDRMDRIERIGANAEVRVNGSLTVRLGTEQADRRNLMGYQFAEALTENITFHRDRFVTGSIMAGFRFAFRERSIRLPDREFTMRSRWPVLHVQASRSVAGLWNGDIDLWRVDLMLDKTFRMRMIGDLTVHVLGGMAQPGSPYPFLYNLRGTFDRRMAVVVEKTFQVMRPNEFLADRYVALHVRHSFGNLLFRGRKWRPVPILVGNAAWGRLDHPERHMGYSFTQLNSGYYEAGIQLDQLVRTNVIGMGAGLFMRMGEHRLKEQLDNFALQLTMNLR